MRVLVFKVAGARVGIALEGVREIVRAVAITALPESPAAVSGVIDLRGSVIPVFDLRRRFGAPAGELDPGERFVIARTARRTVALRVDEVDWIREIPDQEVQEVADLTTGSPYVAGVARAAEGLLLIHDLETFLSVAEEEALDVSLAAHGLREAQ